MRGREVTATAVMLAVVLTSCASSSDPVPASGAGSEVQVRPSESVSLDGIDIRVYVADSPAEWSQGLEGYDSLADGEGMLFAFGSLETRAFTMKGVTFPIDVLFFDDDLAVSLIAPMDPGDTRIVQSPDPSAYVLELPQGWAQDNGIVLGSRLTVAE